jgi:hypothetical protein
MPAADFAAPFQSSELAAAPRASHHGRRIALLVGGWTLYALVFVVLFGIIPSPSMPGREWRGAWTHQLVLSLLPAWLWAACTPLIVRTTRRLAARASGTPADGEGMRLKSAVKTSA